MAMAKEELERLGVFISAIGLASSIAWSACSTSQQAAALKQQASATEHQVQETRFSTTMSMVVYFSESGRRIEEARAAKTRTEAARDSTGWTAAETIMQFELGSLLFTTNVYLANLESLSIDHTAARLLTDGTLGVLASGVPCNTSPEQFWESRGAEAAAARASELNLTSPPCPETSPPTRQP